MVRVLYCLSLACLLAGSVSAFERVVVCEEAYQED